MPTSDPARTKHRQYQGLSLRCIRGAERTHRRTAPQADVMSAVQPPLSETHPELAAQAYGWDPTSLSAGSNKKREWECPNAHRFVASINNRISGKGCPYCANKKVLVGFNDLASA